MPGLATAFAQGLAAARPAASAALEGYFYLSTDTNGGTLYQCKSSAWVQVAKGVSEGAGTPLTTKGDVLGHSTVDARIPVGSDGQVLTADSAQTLGLKWAAGGGGAIIGSTAVGSEPGTPNSGDVDLYSAAATLARYNGSLWVPWGPIYKFTKPYAATGGPSTTQFGWINQNSASVDQTGGGIFLSCPLNAADSWTFLVKTIPTTPYNIYMYLDPQLVNINFMGTGMILRKSSDGSFIAFGMYANSNTYRLQIGHGTSGGPSITVADKETVGEIMYKWLRISDDGVNRTYHVSVNGINWTQFYTQAHATPLVPDQYGFGAEARNASYAVGVNCLSIQEA